MQLKKRQFNVYLPPLLVDRVKRAARDRQQSLSSFVEDSLVSHLLLTSEAPGRARRRTSGPAHVDRAS
jgi:hypothetical protein